MTSVLTKTVLGFSFVALSPLAAFATQVDVTIDKDRQEMRVVVDGAEKYVWPVSTAAKGYNTPNGHFHVFRLEKEHFSKEWDNSPMPNSMFFTGIGHAMHGSFHVKSLGSAVSHGCVRLQPANAAILYDIIKKAGFKNNTVTIKGGNFGFFDRPQELTTEQTFHMQPNQYGHGGAPAGNQQASAASNGIFTTTNAQPKAPSGTIFDLFKTKRASTDVKPEKLKKKTKPKVQAKAKVAPPAPPAPVEAPATPAVEAPKDNQG